MLLEIEQAPVAVITAGLVAFVVAETTKVEWYPALAGAPVKVTVGTAFLTTSVTVAVAVVSRWCQSG
jgi:hypothetical protein